MESRNIDLETIPQKLQNARIHCGKSIKYCADLIGASVLHYKKIENGEVIPTLPELETITTFLSSPVSEIIENQERSLPTPPISNSIHLIEIRNSVIGTLLQIEREKRNISLKEVSELCSISRSRLRRYESGFLGIPLNDLLKLANFLSMELDAFFDKNSPVGIWQYSQQIITRFLALPTDLQEFISDPANMPYLELAKTLKNLRYEDFNTLNDAIQLILKNLPSTQKSNNQ